MRKRKAEVLNDFENNVSESTKHRRHVTGNEEINKLCLEWFKDAVNRRINVTGPLLKEKALVYANDSIVNVMGWSTDCRNGYLFKELYFIFNCMHVYKF